jgi:hypothetical protein
MSDIILSVFGLKLDCKNIIFIELPTDSPNFKAALTATIPPNPVQ